MNSLEWWKLISKKRCKGYAHSQDDDDDVYNESLQPFFNINKIENSNPGR
jgi:hypothetical protein